MWSGAVAVFVAVFGVARADDEWKFEYAYPPHYVARALDEGEAIAIDGVLNETAWADVPWTTEADARFASGFVDITQHTDVFLDSVPPSFQTRVKMRWDDNFFYVGAELREPFVYGERTGHNTGQAPYVDRTDALATPPPRARAALPQKLPRRPLS